MNQPFITETESVACRQDLVVTTFRISEILDTLIPDALAISHVKSAISESLYHGVEFDDGVMVIPEECQYVIFSKSVTCHRMDVGFGSVYRCVVSIGNVHLDAHKIPVSEYCFVTVWYSLDAELITMDFDKTLLQ